MKTKGQISKFIIWAETGSGSYYKILGLTILIIGFVYIATGEHPSVASFILTVLAGIVYLIVGFKPYTWKFADAEGRILRVLGVLILSASLITDLLNRFN